MKKKVGKIIAKTAIASAKAAVGTASGWTLYQFKEPAILKKDINSK